MIPLPDPSSFMPNTAESPTPPLPTPPPGSISTAGKSTTPPSLPLPSRERWEEMVAARPKQTLPAKVKHSPPITAPKREVVPFTPQDKAELATLLGQVCEMQKAYGRSPTSLQTLVEGYSFLLDQFTLPEIRQALKTYLLTRDDIPSPANIAQLIDPTLQPLSQVMVHRIFEKMKTGGFVSDKEREYVRRFEQQELQKVNMGDGK